MGNWSNARLVLIGSVRDLRSFHARARQSPLHFTDEMRQGEGGELSWDRLGRSPASRRWERTYYFQTARDDERAHFRKLSTCYPRCWFVVGYSDPNGGFTGGYLIRDGRCRAFRVTDAVQAAYLKRAGYREDDDGDANEDRFWEAQFQMMDGCVAHGRGFIRCWERRGWTRTVPFAKE